MSTGADPIEVRLTPELVADTLAVIAHVNTIALEQPGGLMTETFLGVHGFFKNAARVFELRNEADRIEAALKAAR